MSSSSGHMDVSVKMEQGAAPQEAAPQWSSSGWGSQQWSDSGWGSGWGSQQWSGNPVQPAQQQLKKGQVRCGKHAGGLCYRVKVDRKYQLCCRPDKWCDAAPEADRFRKDEVAVKMREFVIDGFFKTPRGEINPESYVARYQALRAEFPLPVPCGLTEGLPKSRFGHDAVQPLIMWEDKKTQAMWPNVGRLSTRLFMPIFVDPYGCTFRNVWTFMAN
jgi:hypothetical protein